MTSALSQSLRASLAIRDAAQTMLNGARRVLELPAAAWEEFTDADQDRARRVATVAVRSLDPQVVEAARLRLAQALVVLEDLNAGRALPRSFASLTDSAKVAYLRCARQLVDTYHAYLEGFGPLNVAEQTMLERLAERQRLSPGQRLAHDGIVTSLQRALVTALRGPGA